MATVKNEFQAAPSPSPSQLFHFHCAAAIFPPHSSVAPPNPQHSLAMAAKEESDGNSWSPLHNLSDYFSQPDEDILSMSSLDVVASSSFQSCLTTEEEEEQGAFFTGFSSSAPPIPPTSPSTPSSSLSQIFQPCDGNNILLNSVVRSRIDEINNELFSDEMDTQQIIDNSAGNQFQQQNRIMPPPPPPHGFVPHAQPQDSLATIRSFNFQQPALPSLPCGARLVPPAVVSPYAAGGMDSQVLLVHMLVGCAHAVASQDDAAARVMLARLRQLTRQDGSPMERLASYVAEALAARLNRSTGSALFRGLVTSNTLLDDRHSTSNMLEAFSTFYDYLPIGKFDHLTMNQVILDAVEKERAIHILDLQLWFGTQWPALLQALATRPGGPPRVRITAVGTSAHDLRATGLKLTDCARHLRVHLEYKELLLSNLGEEFHAGLVKLYPGEAFIVNSLSQFHYLLGTSESPSSGGTSGTGNNRFSKFISHIRFLRPKVLVMTENDASHNSPDFLTRFGECLKFYSAVFDAMATCASSPSGRLKMEALFAAPKIRNIIACEGIDRVERHECMADWSKRLQSAGFRPLPLSLRAVNQAKLLLRLYYTNGYTLESQRGTLVLGWRGLPLNTISAWRVG